MSKFTPGPWWVEDRHPDGAIQIQARHRGEGSSYCVASVNYHEAPEANAILIAAAPKLLAALEFALRDMEMTRAAYATHAPNVGVLEMSITQARAALKAATGE